MSTNREETLMLSKYSPAQLAKSTAALLSSLVLFLGLVGAFVADVIPADGNGAAIGVAIAAVCAILVRTATFLTTSAPTLEQIAKHADQVIELVAKVRPAAISPRYANHGDAAGDNAGDDPAAE